jgi:hypothetical protein
MDIPAILQQIRPGASWYLAGESYEGLEWRDEVQSKPTLNEIEAAWPLGPLASDINAERERRILAGKTFAITGYGDIPVDGRPTTQLNLLALKDTARDLKAANVTGAVIPFRDTENNQHMLSADQVIELVNVGKAYVQGLYSASWAIKLMDPVPDDFADDSHWP